jgi:hypothetical protein
MSHHQQKQGKCGLPSAKGDQMSHHFDSETARENPSLNILDLYLFAGDPGNTVMAMTVNADVGISTPDILHHEGLYAFRFDVNNDAVEEVTFKFRFGPPRHLADSDHSHVQSYQVLRAQGSDTSGDQGELLLEGETGSTAIGAGSRAFAGTRPEMWAADAVAFFNLLQGLYKEDRYDADVFLHKKNFFKGRNVTALVLEVPTSLIGEGTVRAWATASLFGHAPEMQIYRWGLPLFTHLFLSDPATMDLVERFHSSVPVNDRVMFGEAVARFVSRLSGRSGSAIDHDRYGEQVARRLCPVMLPYALGSTAVFDRDRFNGRPLSTDAYDVMLSLASGVPVADGVAPDVNRIHSEFPYYGKPFDKAEQSNYVALAKGFYDS